jgi:hypothetical protein
MKAQFNFCESNILPSIASAESLPSLPSYLPLLPLLLAIGMKVFDKDLRINFVLAALVATAFLSLAGSSRKVCECNSAETY